MGKNESEGQRHTWRNHWEVHGWTWDICVPDTILEFIL